MKKIQYIQPKSEIIEVVMNEVMQGDPASGGSFPSNLPQNPAPHRVAPVAGTDSLGVWM